MATEYDNDDEQEQQDENGPKGLRNRLRDVERENKDLATKVAEYERNEAIRGAGLDGLNETQLSRLQGKNADELRRDAESLGFIQPKPDVDPAVQAAHERIADAAGTGKTQVKTSKEDEYANAKTPQEVLEIAQRHNSATTWDAF